MGRTAMGCVCALAVLLAAAPCAGAAEGGLVAAYGFDEGFGNTIADASGSGNTATATSTTWTAGRNGQALSFSGSSGSYVTVADSTSLRLTTALTLEAWVNPP